MSWRWQWQLKNPCDILERKQEREARERARSQGRHRQAKAKVAELFEGLMTQDESEQVEGLLQTWYDYEDSYRPDLGYPRISPSCRGYDPGNVHDDGDDRDAKLNKLVAGEVNACIAEIDAKHRPPINVHFRNKKIRASIHRNPRARNQSIEQQHEAYQDAKLALWSIMKNKGLVR